MREPAFESFVRAFLRERALALELDQRRATARARLLDYLVCVLEDRDATLDAATREHFRGLADKLARENVEDEERRRRARFCQSCGGRFDGGTRGRRFCSTPCASKGRNATRSAQ